MDRLFRNLPVTAEQLRDDRIVEEALAGRADPLHLSAVFGFGPCTGLRYAQAARDTAEPGSREDLSGGTGPRQMPGTPTCLVIYARRDTSLADALRSDCISASKPIWCCLWVLPRFTRESPAR